MNSKITLGILLTIATFAALFLGSTIGQAKFVDLSIYGIIAFGFLYLIYIYKFTWQIVLLLTWSGVNFRYGFSLSSTQYSIALLIVYGVVLTMLRRNPYPKPDLFRRVNSSRFAFWIFALLLYGIFSFTINKVSPYSGGGEYSTKNMLKAYSQAYGPSMIILAALIFPFSFTVGKGVVRTILLLLFVSCLVNMINMVYLFKQGYGALDPIPGSDEPAGALFIPIINATFGPYTLRGVGPISVMIAFAFISTPGWFQRQTVAMKVLTLAVLTMGLGGAVMSGGRAAVLLCLFWVGLLALVHRRIILIFASICLGVFVIAAANLFSTHLNRELPIFVARPLQYVMIEKGEAMDSIDSSSSMRSALFFAGIDEWKSDPRIIFFGRSVYVSSDIAELKGIVGNTEAFVQIGLETGACHALIPSALLQYGVVGAVLYYIVFFSIARFFWKVYRSADHEIYSDELRMLAFLMAVATYLSIFVASIGGHWFGPLQVIMVILFKSMAARDEKFYFEKRSEGLKVHPAQIRLTSGTGKRPQTV